MDTIGFLIRFVLSFATTFLIVRFIYYPKKGSRKFLFTFLIFNALIFFICFFLNSIVMNVGFAFGLFAIFSILRYRTETIPIREMTYQFIVIAIGAINGLVNTTPFDIKIMAANLIIILLVLLFDALLLKDDEKVQLIRYEKIELIKDSERENLMSDLKERTGLNIYRIDIIKIDFLRDTADLNIFYK